MMKAQNAWLPTSTLLLVFGCLLFSPTSAEPETGKVIGSLKFGMAPKEVEALPECSSGTECLYEIADKNRYFTLFYQPNPGTTSPQSATEPGPDAQLALIDIDMGLYTKEWYGELQHILANQYPITHPITEQASGAFQEGSLNELDLGLADATVLLKVVRGHSAISSSGSSFKTRKPPPSSERSMGAGQAYDLPNRPHLNSPRVPFPTHRWRLPSSFLLA